MGKVNLGQRAVASIVGAGIALIGLAFPVASTANWGPPVALAPSGIPGVPSLGTDGVLRVGWAHDQSLDLGLFTERGSALTRVVVAPHLGDSWLFTNAPSATVPLGAGRTLTMYLDSNARVVFETTAATGQRLYSFEEAPRFGDDEEAAGLPVRTLPSGGALACVGGDLFFVAPTGALEKTLVLPRPHGADYCMIGQPPGPAVVAWGSGVGGGNTWWVATVLHTDSLSSPVRLPSSWHVVSSENSLAALAATANGSVAVSWTVGRANGAGTGQMDVGWISPSGATGPVVPLGRHRGNGGGGFAVSLNAIGPTTVLAAFDTKETGAMVSEQIAASGHVSGRTVVFKDDGATQQFTAGNGSRVVLAWQPGEFDSLLYASVWDRGRWSPPTLLDKCRGSRATALLCPDLAGVAINSSGKTAVTWAFGGGTVFRPFAAID